MKFSVSFALATSLITSASAFIIPRQQQRQRQQQQTVRSRCPWTTTSTTTTTATTLNEAQELWRVERVDQISDWLTNESAPRSYPNPLSLKANVPHSWFVEQNAAVAAKVDVDLRETVDDSCSPDDEPECSSDRGLNSEAFILAGPRREIVFDPKEAKAAIVTCGGLCPGLNTVIRELVLCLRRQYGVTKTVGIPAGYRGFRDATTWRELDEKTVSNLHNIGGSTLGSSRGGHDTNAIVDSLVEQKVNLLFVIGGDGTVRGAAKIADEVKRRGLAIAVAVVPKTIDNDVPLLDRTFGFETAVEAARKAINVAETEANGFPFCLGVVKVMGRNSGFIAMHSAMGSGFADLCLVPEVDFELDPIVDHLYHRLVQNDKAIVVVAEGAGQKLMAEMGANGETMKDASGNVLLDDIGPWLCQELKKRINAKLEDVDHNDNPYGDKVSVKYVDPSYMVRGIPPNTADNLYCTQLAHNAVHGAMSGFSSFLVGSINTRACYVPINLVANKRNVIDVRHQGMWEYVVFSTGQPSFQTEEDPRDDKDVITTASGGIVFSTTE